MPWACVVACGYILLAEKEWIQLNSGRFLSQTSFRAKAADEKRMTSTKGL